MSIATSASSSDAVSQITCKQLVQHLLTKDVEVDLLLWVIFAVNNDFEAPLHTAST